jgi:PEP-CTERM motif
MYTRGLRALSCATALVAAALMPAQANVVTFDDLAPNLFFAPDSFTSGGFKFAPDSGLHNFLIPGGFTVVDTAAGFQIATPPTGNATQFASVMNDGSLTMTADTDFTLAGFDFGFVAPAPVLGAGSPGRVVIAAVTSNDVLMFDSFDFGPSGQQTGSWAFTSASLANHQLAGLHLKSVTFFACLYDGGPNNTCVYPASNQAQFSIDNITSQIPEPGSLMLALAAIGLAGAASRRRTV